jgi:glycosyltransferase involved in cell wall biosynthesis
VVIGRCLKALTSGALPNELEVIVVCNGCTDDTAEVAGSFGRPVRVLETDIPSKTNALNLGDDAAKGFPRFYVDADVTMTLSSLREVAAVLENGGALAASPAVEPALAPDASRLARAFHRFWMALPYVQEGMMGAGVYALSREGRQRFGRFPDIISDDGYVRLLFSPAERVEVRSATSQVWAPSTMRDLIATRTRSRLGVYQLRERYPDLYRLEVRSKDYGGAVASILKRPELYLDAMIYLWVTLVVRLRARRRQSRAYVWERDDSSRVLSSAAESHSHPRRAVG